jgi:carbonic anhydrase
VIDDFLRNDGSFAAVHDPTHYETRPSLRRAVDACMDSRLDVFAALGLHQGGLRCCEVPAGVITDDK